MPGVDSTPPPVDKAAFESNSDFLVHRRKSDRFNNSTKLNAFRRIRYTKVICLWNMSYLSTKQTISKEFISTTDRLPPYLMSKSCYEQML